MADKMPIPIHYEFARYLAAKKSVDDRALNRHVWDTLLRVIAQRSRKEPFLVLEIGAGIGTMIERLTAWNMTECPVLYTAIDAEPNNIDVAQRRLIDSPPSSSWRIVLETVDLFDFIEQNSGRSWDLLVAHAFLDLLDVPARLPDILSLIKPGGLFYFTINFDGLTILEPALDPEYDAEVMRLYHETMDKRMANNLPSGDSHTGRHLFQNLRANGAAILAAGSSDWVVFPQNSGYPDDEAYFLHFIIHTIAAALENKPGLEHSRFAEWIAERHAQVQRGELIYIAHQIDFVGLWPG